MATSDRKTPPNAQVPNWPVPTFPTPVISDQIVSEIVSTEAGVYVPLEYGTLYNDVDHGAFPKDKPGFKLVFQGPVDANGYWVRRTWVNDRVDQETYNYSITYDQSNTAFPTVTRVLVVPRATYTPETILTADVQFPQAKLVEEQMINDTQPPELTSLYVKVVRTYQTIPGPIVITQDFDPVLNVMVNTSRQIVLSTDEFDPTTPAGNLLTLELRESPITQYTKMRIRSYLSALPESFTETKVGKFSFPALVFGWVVAVLQWTLDPDRSEVANYPDTMRAAPEVPAIFQVLTEYFTSEPTVTALYAIPTRNLIYNGTSFNISVGNVLNDEIEVTAAFSDDSKYGDLTETHTFAATALTATAYASDIGTYQIVGCDITRYRGAIFIRQQTSLLLV